VLETEKPLSSPAASPLITKPRYKATLSEAVAGSDSSSAGDVNGDGLDDLIVGTKGADPSGRSNAGKSYVVFGKVGSSAIDLSTIADASNSRGFVINGEVENDYSGSSVSSAGDVNGDGLDDLIVGAYGADPSDKSSAGKSYVACAGNEDFIVTAACECVGILVA
jgi:hypothetical protein